MRRRRSAGVLGALAASGALALIVGLAAGTGPATAEDAGDDPYGDVIEDFRKRIKGATVEKAAEAVELLDPTNPRSLPELVPVLSRGHWFVRGAAIEALSETPAGPLRSELRLHLVTHEDAWVREGIAYSIALQPVPGDADALIGALDDEAWMVRRTAARALGEIVSRGGVGRLIRAGEEEQDLRVLVWIRASLRAISGTDFGRNPKAWREWWERHKDRPEWKKQGDEVVREEFEGIPLETVTLDVPIRTAGEADDPDAPRPRVFVLAPFGYTHDWFRPYLDEAAEFVDLTYVTLPTVQEVTGQSGYGRAIPVYPVDKLAKALDALRKSHDEEQIVVMAAGPVIWIAERYAQRYPKHVAGLVLVNGWLDRTSYANALIRLRNDGTGSERWVANLLTGEIEAAHTPIEGERLRRILLTHALNDRRDSEAFRLWRNTVRDHGFVTVPPIQFTRHTKIEVPTLFTFPDDSLVGGGTPEDLRRIRDSFEKPPPVTAVIRESKGMLHMEDPAEFLRILRGFLRHASLIR